MQEQSALNEFYRELFICSHESLRLGDAVYWLYNLNKHMPQTSHMILTDPVAACEIKLKPFNNNIKVHFCPINPAI
jgi:hypothetical protein